MYFLFNIIVDIYMIEICSYLNYDLQMSISMFIYYVKKYEFNFDILSVKEFYIYRYLIIYYYISKNIWLNYILF